ncbi:MAG: Asp-tRNA(Asn)/Glu-tRNA(Gln) amidotransferase subunit GatA [Clostridiales Family XIII bacterium]|jgi:aspartyl-tRNA(Asn)/glutamyl-tRNA(Gln) amidotransferase subunit A|nr:Asp-tRNA(Asn)/Glu-tRNA(Gln) amidotransferase subunit GatA [Clostridiales Family XIII bacterium]
MDLKKLTAFEISEKIRRKKISVIDVTNFFLSEIKKDFRKKKNDESKINAFVSIEEDYAIKQAKIIQEKLDAGEILSEFMGVPIGIKDNIATDFGYTTAASKILSNYKSPYNATVIEKIINAGMIILGKTNMDEFAMGGSTETSYYGITRNPINLKKVPGGSSGGSAAAVSYGFCPIAIGSDTGGSIRQPAAFTGIVGVKPTYGSVSRYGLFAYGSSLDQIGPMAKDVKDAAILLSIISGKDKKDSTAIIEEPFNFSEIINNKKELNKIKDLKIGLPKNYFMKGLSPDVKNAVKKSFKKFEKLGAMIEEFELPLIEYAVPTYLIISCAEASSNLSRYDGVKYGFSSDDATDINDLYIKTRSKGFGTEVKRRIILGSFVLSSGYFDAYYKKALKVRRLIKNAFDKAFTKFDIILTPTTPTSAYNIGENIKDPLTMYLGDIYTTSMNLTGMPAITIPYDEDEEGLPISIQLIGKEFSESVLMKTAFEFQRKSEI